MPCRSVGQLLFSHWPIFPTCSDSAKSQRTGLKLKSCLPSWRRSQAPSRTPYKGMAFWQCLLNDFVLSSWYCVAACYTQLGLCHTFLQLSRRNINSCCGVVQLSNVMQHWSRPEIVLLVRIPATVLVIVTSLAFRRRPRGPTDKAPDYESGDSRFESWRGRIFF